MSCGLPAIPIIGLPAKLANGLGQRWLRLLIYRLKTINTRKGKDRSVATDGFFTERAPRKSVSLEYRRLPASRVLAGWCPLRVRQYSGRPPARAFGLHKGMSIRGAVAYNSTIRPSDRRGPSLSANGNGARPIGGKAGLLYRARPAR